MAEDYGLPRFAGLANNRGFGAARPPNRYETTGAPPAGDEEIRFASGRESALVVRMLRIQNFWTIMEQKIYTLFTCRNTKDARSKNLRKVLNFFRLQPNK